MISKYFWDLNKSALREAQKALKDPNHPQFSSRMATLLSRCDHPKELFGILPKEKFIEAWPKIRSLWMKRTRQSHQRDWWETLYEQMTQEAVETSAGAKGEGNSFSRRFGDMVKEKRIELGLSQKQVAIQTGLKQPVISKIEVGKKNITLFTMARLNKVLRLKILE